MTTFNGVDEGFQKALDEAQRRQEAFDHDDASAFPHPMALPPELGPARGAGGEDRWGLAMTWTGEWDETTAHPPALTRELAVVSSDVESIAAELGIDAAPNEDQLTRQWRAFLWRNHPDRQPAHARGRADARVAIANSLYDQAQRKLRNSG